MSSHGNNNNNNNDAANASSSSSNMGRGGAQPATTSYGRGVGRGAGRGRGQPRGRSCYRVCSPTTLERDSPVLTMVKCGQMGHFVRNCPRGNNLQQAPPRGGSTAHRSRGGSVEAGHWATPSVASTPVEAGPYAMNSPVSFFPTIQGHIPPKISSLKPKKYDELMNTTQPPAKEMESLSLTAQPTGTPTASATSPPVSPRVSAPSSPASRPGPGDSDTAVDEELPPYFWKPADTPEGRQEQDRLFVEYYKKRGFAYDEEKKVFLPRAHNYWT